MVVELLGARTEDIGRKEPMTERRAQPQSPDPGEAGPSGNENQHSP